MQDDPGRKGNGMIWVAVGCGGLLLLTLCVATGFGAYFVMDRGSSSPMSSPMPQAQQPTGPGSGPMMPSQGGGTPGATSSVEVTAAVTVVTGSRPVSEGAICSFRVERLPRSNGAGYWCRTQAVCGGKLLFGGPTAGYFNCRMTVGGGAPEITGGDPDTSSADNDASFAIDTTESSVVLRDDATSQNGEYTLVAHINSLR
ncbi:MAG: hypothetical protein GXP55_22910 [Deltaproteobacteria bacterium]|nr:hypothetical protein [Deltaproteobacteria bacterium]